jgi:hypothetical protein
MGFCWKLGFWEWGAAWELGFKDGFEGWGKLEEQLEALGALVGLQHIGWKGLRGG